MREFPHDDGADQTVRSGASNVLERFYPASSTSRLLAARAVMALALEGGIGPACRARIGGAVAEVVDNACRRAYPRGGGEVRLHARCTGCDLHVHVEDDGIGFEVSRLDEELLATPLHSGLSRAISLCEDLRIESQPGRGTRVMMRFTATFLAFDEERILDLADHDFLMPDAARRLLHALRRPETAHLHQLSPALAVVAGRLLHGPEPRSLVERALWRS